MSKYEMVEADGSDPIIQAAAKFAVDCQDACNLFAIVNEWARHLADLRKVLVGGDLLINHPVTLAFLSKLNSLCRNSTDRELNALEACYELSKGNKVQYEVIPL